MKIFPRILLEKNDLTPFIKTELIVFTLDWYNVNCSPEWFDD